MVEDLYSGADKLLDADKIFDLVLKPVAYVTKHDLRAQEVQDPTIRV